MDIDKKQICTICFNNQEDYNYLTNEDLIFHYTKRNKAIENIF